MTILFDLDGTLIDSTEAILEGFGVTFDKFKLPKKSDEEIKELIGHPLDIMFEMLGCPKELIQDLVSCYKEHYRTIATQKTILLPFAKESVIEASKIAKLGIVTTKTSQYSKVLMEHFGLMSYFGVLIGREDVVKPKPNAEPILKAIEKLEANINKTFMIGDTCIDMRASKNAGVKGVAVHSGYDSITNLKSCCEVVKSNSLEAVEVIKNFKG